MSFGSDMKRFSGKTERKIEKAVRKISLDAFSEVILRSPVDTGRFRGNWQVGIGSAPSGVSSTTDKSGAATVAGTQAAVAGAEIGDVVFLANNLPYAQRLEDGWSQQAPGGMVRLTQQRFQAIANKVFAQIGREG